MFAPTEQHQSTCFISIQFVGLGSDAKSDRGLLLVAILFVVPFELYSSGHSVYSDYYFIRWSLTRT
jgi:hypothetical protein